MLQEVLDLDGRVIGEGGELAVESLRDAYGVRRAVEEIGVAEGNVRGSGCGLAADILQHDVLLHHAECAVVDRDYGTVPAEVLAAAACFRVPDGSLLIENVELRVAAE